MPQSWRLTENRAVAAPRQFVDALLYWFRGNARALPWRVTGKAHPDPYQVWLSEIMLQQTTVPAVIPYFERFIKRWPRVFDLAAADREDVLKEWAGLGYYARARNLHACAKVIANDYCGVFPCDVSELMKLPGIGPYTAAAIASIAYDAPAAAVDGNVERVISRAHGIDAPLAGAKPGIKAKAEAYVEVLQAHEAPDFTQGLMELGAVICTPKSPKCSVCPVSFCCAVYNNQLKPEDYPRRIVKTNKPEKAGYVYWIYDNAGRVLIETRPETGVLAAMPALPVSVWVVKGRRPEHLPCMREAPVQETPVFVRHVFTHFALELTGYAVRLPEDFVPGQGYRLVSIEEIERAGMPSLFLKAARQFKKCNINESSL